MHRIPNPTADGGKVIRVLLNPNPFTNEDPPKLSPVEVVQERGEICLAELSESKIRDMIETIRDAYDAKKMTAKAVETSLKKKTEQDTE